MINCLHKFLHEKLWGWANRNGEISTEDAKKCIGMQHNIPKPLRIVILKEMQNQGLLVWTNRDNIQLKKKPLKVLDNTSEMYRAVGCF